MVNYHKHLSKNSLRPSLETTFLFSNVWFRVMLYNKGIMWLILKYSFPTNTPFNSKIMCNGLTSASSMSTSGGDLRPSKENSSPLSSSTIPWRTGGSFSSSTQSNPTRGDCNHDGTNGLRDGRNANAHWGRDVELQRDEGWTRNDVGFFHFSSSNMTFPMQFNVAQLSK